MRIKRSRHIICGAVFGPPKVSLLSRVPNSRFGHILDHDDDDDGPRVALAQFGLGCPRHKKATLHVASEGAHWGCTDG